MDYGLILSPSKEQAIPEDTHSNFQAIHIEPTCSILNVISELSLKDFQDLWGLKENKALEVQTFFQLLKSGVVKTEPAISLYQGLAFRSFHSFFQNKNQLLESGALAHLFILSAFYGVLQATSPISNYRLDFKVPILVKDQRLTKLWKESYQERLESLNKDLWIDLASKEFSGIFDKSKLDFISIDFAVDKRGKKTRPSAVIKQARGLMAAWISSEYEMFEKASKDSFKQKLMTFSEDGWSFIHSEELSERSCVFYFEKKKA